MEKSVAIDRLAALAQETRLDIVRLLVRRGDRGCAAGDIGAALRLPSATLAFHLNTLTTAGLLLRQRSGRQNIYRADIGAVHALSAYLLENCCSETGDRKGMAEADTAA